MKKATFDINIPVTVLREGKRFIAYTPALDLSTSGKSFEEAKRHFEEAVKIFIEEVSDHGTIEEVLKGLGWKKLKKQWKSPLVVSQENERVRVCI